MTIHIKEKNDLDLSEIASFAILVGVYEIRTTKTPTIKIKVLQRGEGDFIAIPNVTIKGSRNEPPWSCGIGKSEKEALNNSIKTLVSDLNKFHNKSEIILEWEK